MSQIVETKTLNAGGKSAQFTANADDPYMINFHGRQAEINALELVACRFMNDDAIALDIGANIGVTSIAMARLFKSGKILSFEPSKSNYNFLCQNLKENEIKNVIPDQIAIGDKEGEIEFLHTAYGAGSHVVTDAHLVKNMETYTVKKNSIDGILKEKKLERVDFVKIDVEGLELVVLKGMEETIEKFNPYIS